MPSWQLGVCLLIIHAKVLSVKKRYCVPRNGNFQMSSLKNTVDKLKNLESEKLSLLAEVEELKKLAEAKSNVLANDIAALKEEINSLKALMGAEKPQLPLNDDSAKQRNLVHVRELAEKTLNESRELGDQVFSASPFAENYDAWLSNLHRVISDFESDSLVKVDDQFVKDRSQILLEVENVLSKKKMEESNIGSVAKALTEHNHLLVETDKEYAEKAKELSAKKDSELQRLSNRVRELERQVLSQVEEDSKRKILKKKTDDKVPQMKLDLKSAKNELELVQQNFAAEQHKLDEDYEAKKQSVMGQMDSLREELVKLETDTSVEARQAACKALADAVDAQVQRISSIE
jgi:hypothetical protein